MVRVLLLVVVAWVVSSVVLLWIARDRAIDGIERLERAADRLSSDALLRGKGEDALRAAARDFDSAHDLAGHAILAPWSVVPLLGQNADSVAVLTSAAADVARIGERASAESRDVLRQSPATGAARIAMLDQLEGVLDRADRRLARLDLGPDFLLLPPLADARDRFRERLQELRQTVVDARSLAEGAQRLLTGPRRYLVLAANNAEMRAGSGMLLSAGVAEFADGQVTVGPFESTTLIDVPAGAVTLQPAVEELWGWLDPEQHFWALATTPRFDVTASIAAEMWEAAKGQRVDGVLVVDPVALGEVLDAQGPVTVGPSTLSAGDVVSYLLLEQYELLGQGDVLTSASEQQVRRDQLSAVAGTVVSTLSDRPWESSRLAQGLGQAARGRHVLAWARDPVEQRAWEAGGIAGELEDASLSVSLMNFGGNKLDQFMAVRARLRVVEDGEQSVVTVRLRIRNDAPPGLPTYVAGPHPDSGVGEGVYQGIVAVNVPGVASLPEVDGPGETVVAGIDGPTKIVAQGYLQIARGEEATVRVRFRLPEGSRALDVEPSARVPPITWRHGSARWEDRSRHSVEW